MAGPTTDKEDRRKANRRQVGGSHYKKMVLEHWDIVTLLDLDYFQGQITKYCVRWRDKNGIPDLEKMMHFAEKYLEVERMRAQGNLTRQMLEGILSDLKEKEQQESSELAGEVRPADDTAFTLAEKDCEGSTEIADQPHVATVAYVGDSQLPGNLAGTARPPPAVRAAFRAMLGLQDDTKPSAD